VIWPTPLAEVALIQLHHALVMLFVVMLLCSIASSSHDACVQGEASAAADLGYGAAIQFVADAAGRKRGCQLLQGRGCMPAQHIRSACGIVTWVCRGGLGGSRHCCRELQQSCHIASPPGQAAARHVHCSTCSARCGRRPGAAVHGHGMRRNHHDVQRAAQRLQLSQSRLCGRRRDGAAGGLGRGSTSRARGRLCWERLLCCRGLSLCCREPHAPESQGLLDALLEVALAGLDRLHLRAQPCMAKPGAVAKGSQAHR